MMKKVQRQQKCTLFPCFIMNYSLGRRTPSFCTSKTVCWQDSPVTSVNVRLIFTLPLHENTVKDQTATEKNPITPHLKALLTEFLVKNSGNTAFTTPQVKTGTFQIPLIPPMDRG